MQGYGKSAVLDLLVQRAQRDLRWSRVFLYVGAIICMAPGLAGLVGIVASLGQVSAGSLVQAILLTLLIIVVGGVGGAYIYWGFYWGWVTIWRWLRHAIGGNAPGSGLNGLAFIVFIILFLWILATVANFYGILGGGIYQYRKAKQIVAAATPYMR